MVSLLVPYQLAALSAAALWAIGGLIAAGPARQLGGPRFTRIRMIYVSVILAAVTTVLGDWGFSGGDIALLGLSGLVGLLIGDAALFTAFAKIGPRRTSILFTTNAPMAAVLGVIVFGERFTIWTALGAVLTVVGVAIAVAYGTAKADDSEFERVDGTLKSGIAWAALGALGQAVGAILAKPVVEEASAFGAATWRAIIATIALWLFASHLDRIAGVANPAPWSWRYFWILFISALLAMVIGMTLLLYALGKGDAGVVTILSATTPVLMLPLLWITTRIRPPAGAWGGAALTVVGVGLLVL